MFKVHHVAVILFLGVHSIAVEAPVPQDIRTRMFTAEIFTTVRKNRGKKGRERKKQKCPSCWFISRGVETTQLQKNAAAPHPLH